MRAEAEERRRNWYVSTPALRALLLQAKLLDFEDEIVHAALTDVNAWLDRDLADCRNTFLCQEQEKLEQSHVENEEATAERNTELAKFVEDREALGDRRFELEAEYAARRAELDAAHAARCEALAVAEADLALRARALDRFEAHLRGGRQCAAPDCTQVVEPHRRSNAETCSPRCKKRLTRLRRAQEPPRAARDVQAREADFGAAGGPATSKRGLAGTAALEPAA